MRLKFGQNWYLHHLWVESLINWLRFRKQLKLSRRMISSSICESWMIKSWIIQVTQVILWYACLGLFISWSELGFEVISHCAASCQNPGQTFTPALCLKKTVIKSANTCVACMLWKANKNFPFLPLYVSAHLFSAEARLTVDCHFLTAPPLFWQLAIHAFSLLSGSNHVGMHLLHGTLHQPFSLPPPTKTSLNCPQPSPRWSPTIKIFILCATNPLQRAFFPTLKKKL